MRKLYCIVRFLAHWMANCTIFALVWINCQVHMYPGHLRPLSVIAEKVPNNYIFCVWYGHVRIVHHRPCYHLARLCDEFYRVKELGTVAFMGYRV